MKKLLSVVLAIVMILSIVPMTSLSVSAVNNKKMKEGFTYSEEFFYYTMNDGEVTIFSSHPSGDFIEITNLSGDVVIPSEYRGYPVTKIADAAFYGGHEITSITIPNTVKTIGDSAFYGCSKLKSINMSQSLTSIGADSCDDTSFEYENGGMYIDNVLVDIEDNYSGVFRIKENTRMKTDPYDLFHRCDGITKFVLIGEQTDLSVDANGVLFNKNKTELIRFPAGSSLTSYTIPNSVKVITSGAFEGCSNLMSIAIPNGVITIDDYAFSHCDNLTSITIPDSVSIIGDYAFAWSYDLANITLGNGITMLDSWSFYTTAYYNNSSNWENNILYCGEYVLDAKDSFSGDCVIKDGTRLIAKDAFDGYRCDITSLTIPSSVRYFAEDEFSSCRKLEKFIVDTNNPYYSNDEYGVLFNKDKTVLIEIPNGIDETTYIIPKTVTTIKDSSIDMPLEQDNEYFSTDEHGVLFNADKTILIRYPSDNTETSYTIPSSVKEISDEAFYNCSNLTSVIIPNGVTVIGNRAFYYCESLKSVTLPDSLKLIGQEAFFACYNLEGEIVLPENVELGWFAFYYCSKVTSIELPQSMEVIPPGAFAGVGITNFPKSNSLKKICLAAFSGCSGLASITIPDSVKYVQSGVFTGCSNLKTVVIPESCNLNGIGIFYGCSKLNNVTLPKNMSKIGMQCFTYCTNLSSITIPSNITEIDYMAFYNCNNLSSVLISNSVTTIGKGAFGECKKLETITIPNSVTKINELAFYNCTNLKNIVMYNNVTSIGESAFEGCTGLTDVYYTGSVAKWAAITKGDNNDPLLNATIHFNCVPNCEHLLEEISEVPATCYEDGLTSGEKCSLCDSIIVVPTVIPAGHKYASVVTEATCTKGGYTTYTCSVCGDKYVSDETEPTGHKESTPVKENEINATCLTDGSYDSVVYCSICDIALSRETISVHATGHTWSEWTTVTEATNTTDGLEKRKCSSCSEIEEKAIPRLAQILKDSGTGISLEIPNEIFDETMKLSIKKTTVGIKVDGMINSIVYDIKLLENGVETQPKSKVTVKIPLPAGYDPDNTRVYHVNNSGELENMNAVYDKELNCMIFETNHFSYYAIVEMGEEYNYTFSIQTPSRTEIRCKDGIILHANLNGTYPEGTRIEWTASNGNFDKSVVDDNSLKIISKDKGYTTFTATLYDADGNVLAQDSVEMYSKAGFFDKIGGFFRNLFGTTKIYDN